MIREQTLSLPDALNVAIEVAEALDYAPSGHRPPRHQAGEHSSRRQSRDHLRLRDRARARARRRRRAADGDGHVGRYAGLHEPRAGGGRAGRGWSGRHVRVGLRALRDGRRLAALHRKNGRRGDRRTHGDAGAVGANPPVDRSAKLDEVLNRSMAKAARRALRHRGGVRPGVSRSATRRPVIANAGSAPTRLRCRSSYKRRPAARRGISSRALSS